MNLWIWIQKYFNTWIPEYLNTWIPEYLNTTCILEFFCNFMSDLVFFWIFSQTVCQSFASEWWRHSALLFLVSLLTPFILVTLTILHNHRWAKIIKLTNSHSPLRPVRRLMWHPPCPGQQQRASQSCQILNLQNSNRHSRSLTR